MDFRDLAKRMREVDTVLRSRNLPPTSGEMHIVGRAGKIGEEAGEVFGAAMAYVGRQRESKSQGNLIEKLKGEIADVLIATWMLCLYMGFDPIELIINKADEIIEKNEK